MTIPVRQIIKRWLEKIFLTPICILGDLGELRCSIYIGTVKSKLLLCKATLGALGQKFKFTMHVAPPKHAHKLVQSDSAK